MRIPQSRPTATNLTTPARKAQSSEPNDRQYDRKLEKKMKRLSASELSDLLSLDEQEPVEPGREKG